MGSIRMYQLALELTAGFDISKQVAATNQLYIEALEEIEAMKGDSPKGIANDVEFTIGLWEVKCQMRLITLAVEYAGNLGSAECLDDKLIVRNIAKALGKPIPKEAQED